MRIPALLLPVRSGAWLSAERARGYFLIWLILQAVVAGFMAVAFHAASAADGGKPVGCDFIAFWSAARLTLQHGAGAAYDDAATAALQHSVSAMGDASQHFPFWYPPPFLLLVLVFGLLPYVAALPVFLAAGYAALFAALRRIIAGPWALAALMLSPATLMNTLIGQNGMLSAACFAGAMIWLQTRPALAGACLGMLVCKPHFALLVPLALAAARRWRAFFSCGLAAAGLCAASLALGVGSWRDFLARTAESRDTLQNLPAIWPKIQSLFSAVRQWGGGVETAYAAQALVALAAAAAVWAVARRRAGAGPEIATLTTAALLTTPYSLDYDLVCLLVPMAWLASAAAQTGWRDWEKTGLLLAYALPVATRFLANQAGFPPAPLVLGLVLALCVRRALAPGGEAPCVNLPPRHRTSLAET